MNDEQRSERLREIKKSDATTLFMDLIDVLNKYVEKDENMEDQADHQFLIIEAVKKRNDEMKKSNELMKESNKLLKNLTKIKKIVNKDINN